MYGTTTTILKTIAALGYAVTERHLPASSFGKIRAYVEMHAVKLNSDPVERFIAKLPDDSPEAAYRCACMLAEMVGIFMGG